MPRQMPSMDMEFSHNVDKCLALARAGELIRANATPSTVAYQQLYVARLESLYELAYLKIFVCWEGFLEDTFLRYLCGFQSRRGLQIMVGGVPYYRTLAAAETAMLAGKSFALWHGSGKILARVRTHISRGIHETIIAASASRLDYYAAVRHRIAHGHGDVRVKFDTASMALTGRRFAGARAGAFLRCWDTTATPPTRWIESIAATLKALATAII